VQPTVAGAKGRERLLAEARAMAKLRHRAVVPVHDVGEYAGGVYVAMALVKGGTLHDWIHAEARPWRQVVARFLEAGRGLVAAHAAGIVHRDFKPRNVLVGEGGEVMVADFGIASASVEVGEGDGAGAGAREATSIVGTPAYMAPEQAAGQAVDARADQYSFCVSLWEGLHGQRPQEAETRTQGALLERSHAAPKSRRGVPGWLTDAVARGFAPDPAKRWPTLAALLDRLERGLGRRRRLAMWGMVVAAITGATMVAGYVKTSGGTARPCVEGTAAWNTSDKATVEDAFHRLDASIGGDALARVVPRLDAYAERLASTRLSLCRTTGAQSVALVDRRTLCLDRREAALASLIGTLASADGAVVSGAVDAVDSLPPIEDCALESELAASGVAPPAGLSSAVDAVRARLAEGDDLGRRGHAAQALEIFETAAATARAVGWPHLLGDALERVIVTRDTLELPRMVAGQELAETASKIGDDNRLAFALAMLLDEYVDGSRVDKAEGIIPALRAAVVRAGVTRAVRFRALVAQAYYAIEAHRVGDVPGLLRDAEGLARTVRERIQLLVIKSEAATTPSERVALAQEAVRLAVESYGKSSPSVGREYVRLARLQYQLGEVGAAEESIRAAGATYQARTGTEDTALHADYLQVAGSIARRRGRFDEAVAALERAAAIYQRDGLRERQAQVVRQLGNVAAFAKGDAAKGRVYFEQALELMRAARGPASLEYADMEVSLGAFLAQDGCRGGLKELDHARSILEPLRHPSLVAVYGQLGECLATSDPDGAARLFAAGMALCQERGCPPGTVDHFRAALGTLLASTRRGRDQGLAMLREALANYEKLGDTAMHREVAQRLRDATSRKPQ
jgi:tetratricopeptide (TPR) repeat protein